MSAVKDAIERGKDKAREWNACDPPTEIPAEAAKQIVMAALDGYTNEITAYIDPDDGNAYVLDENFPDDGLSAFVSLTDIFGSHGRTVSRDELQMWETQTADPLEPSNIRVAVILPPQLRDRAGHETFGVPLGGGRVEARVPTPEGEDKITVEVYPESQLENYHGRMRSYDQLERLRDKIIKNGGYMCVGDQMAIGDEIVGGRDQIELLRMLARHWGEQAGDQQGAWRQGFNAGLKEASAQIRTAIDRAKKYGDD